MLHFWLLLTPSRSKNDHTNLTSNSISSSSPAIPSAVSASLSDWLSACLLDSRSTVKQLSRFQSFAYSSPHKIFIITETWLSDHIYNNEILPSGYTIHHKDRPSLGGGVLIALKNIIPSTLIPTPPDLELIAVKMILHQPFIYCVVYVPPSSTDEYCSALFLPIIIYAKGKGYVNSNILLIWVCIQK